MRQRLFPLLLALFLALASLTGCTRSTAPAATAGATTAGDPAAGGSAAGGSAAGGAGAEGAATTTPAPGPSDDGAAAGPEVRTQYPLTLKDAAGFAVTFAAAPQRVVSLSPAQTEMLFAIGRGDRLVGRTQYDDYPAAVQEIPEVGGLTDPSIEAIAGLKPDLVLMSPLSLKYRDQLVNDLQLTVFVAGPENMEQVYETLLNLGQILDAQAAAGAVVQEMQAAVKAVKDKTASLPAEQRPKVFYEVWPDPLMTAGPGTFINELIHLAGGTNIAATAQESWPQFSLEALVAEDPDVILTTFADTPKQLQSGERKGWEKLRAVRNGRVYLLEDQNLIARAGPRLVQGLEWVARSLHPDLFAGKGN